MEESSAAVMAMLEELESQEKDIWKFLVSCIGEDVEIGLFMHKQNYAMTLRNFMKTKIRAPSSLQIMKG